MKAAEIKTAQPFCSKILLFGEYSIIQNSMALSIPFPMFHGKLSFKTRSKESSAEINSELLAFSQYMQELLTQSDLNFDFDLNSFLFDINQGLVFSSTIPSGFGLGSSGALVAAIFARYGQLKQNQNQNQNQNQRQILNYLANVSEHPDHTERKKEDILQLREVFAKMESHFHGKSSGMDPLISYLNDPLLIRSRQDLGVVRLPQFPEDGKGAIFLINTGRPRRTEPLVNLFLEKCKEKNFLEMCQRDFIPTTNQCITSFLEGDCDQLYSSFQALSRLQFEHFSPMIPHLFRKIWETGLEQEDYLLKLCGAGGGGFLLGITKDFQKACQKLRPNQIREVLTL